MVVSGAIRWSSGQLPMVSGRADGLRDFRAYLSSPPYSASDQAFLGPRSVKVVSSYCGLPLIKTLEMAKPHHVLNVSAGAELHTFGERVSGDFENRMIRAPSHIDSGGQVLTTAPIPFSPPIGGLGETPATNRAGSRCRDWGWRFFAESVFRQPEFRVFGGQTDPEYQSRRLLIGSMRTA
jgi:hypothetical protein